MKKRNKIILVFCTTILALSFATVVVLKSPAADMIKFVFGIDRFERKRVKLLFESNHEALLLACRKMILEAKDGKWDYEKLWFATEEGKKLYSRLPEPLKKIEPVYIFISYDQIMVALWGGMTHMGIVVFLEEDDMPWGKKYYKEISKGLWYYDDRCKNDQDFEELIESLRPKKK